MYHRNGETRQKVAFGGLRASTHDLADCFLRKIHKLRNGLRWWQRGFTYLDTIGVTNTHDGSD